MLSQPLPPAPPGWNKTIKDLCDEQDAGLRPSIGWPETQWAIDYERSLLPPGTRFPRKGDVYAAIEPVPVLLFLAWCRPVTTQASYILPTGTLIRVESDAEQPITVNALPVDYKGVEKAALSLWTRLRPDYGGYHLSLQTLELNTRFRWMPEEGRS